LRRPADGARPSRPDRPAVDLEPVMTHLKAERFTEALAALEDDSAPDPERLLLRAVVLTQLGEFESAMQACSALHRLDALDAAALFVVALCREAVGDDHAAGEYHRLAARMDPGFAMPRLHLARLSRKSGWAIARPELQRALQLLEQETERHIALFGGGFTRDALVAMVRSELAALRSHP
ncbi:MAG: CheR family methyltransferase, partial [Polyangiaceae bacterium]